MLNYMYLNDVVNFTCNPGYDLDGDSSLTCLAGGTWSANPPVCRAVQCHVLTNPANGEVIGSNPYTYGDEVRFECNSGYSLVGAASLTCRADGQWDGSPPMCEGCPVSGYVSFDRVCYKAFSERKTYHNARQTCAEDRGLLAMPKDSAANDFIASLQHGSESRWLGLTDAINEGRWVFENGRIVRSSEYINWNIAEPNGHYNENCAALYPTTGNPWIDISCSEYLVFTCQLDKECRNHLGLESGAIPDGSITASSNWNNWQTTKFGRANRVIDYGAWLAAHNTVGAWLQVDLGEPKRVTGTIIQGRHTIDQWVTSYKLQFGVDWISWTTYADNGSETIFPGNTDRITPVTNLLATPVVAQYVRFVVQTWYQHISMRVEVLGCRINSQCNTLANPTNGAVSGSRFYGGAVTFTCNEGYNLDGASTLTCLADATWNGDPPTCEVVQCASPTAPTNGAVESSNVYMHEAHFSCNSGYAISGSSIATCQADGTWSEGYPTCTDIDECAFRNRVCGQNMICTNTNGSYQCSCPVGYSLDIVSSSCEDIDECAIENGPCNQICRNEVGSFQCSCGSGYVLNTDQRRCDDVDECIEDPSICGHYLAVCTNNIGNYECTCRQGYVMMAGGCQDVDECAVGESNCGQDAICQNTEGSYLCTCNDGFIGDGTLCTEMPTTAVATTKTLTTTMVTTPEPETSHPDTTNSPLHSTTSATLRTDKSSTQWQEETTLNQVTTQKTVKHPSTTDTIGFGNGDQIDLNTLTSTPTVRTEPETTAPDASKVPGFWPGLLDLVNGQAEPGDIQQYLNDDDEHEESRLTEALEMVYSQSSDIDSAEKVELLAKATDMLLTSSGELNLKDQATGGFIIGKMAKSIEELSENGASFPQLKPAASAIVDTVSTLVEARVKEEEEDTIKDESHLLPPRKRKAYKEKLEKERLGKKEKQWKLQKESMSALMEQIDHVASALLSSSVVPESATLGKKTVQLAIKKESELGEEPLSLPAGKVDFPTDDALLPFTSSSDVGWKVTGFNDNPYIWDRSAGDIKSSVVDVTLGDAEGKEIPVNGLSEAITIVLQNRPEMFRVGHLVNYKHYDNDTMAFRDFQALENATYGVTLTVRTAGFIEEAKVYGKLGGDPNDVDHDFSKFLSWEDFDITEYEGNKNFTAFIVIPVGKVNNGRGHYTIGLLIDECLLRPCKYSTDIVRISCRYWDSEDNAWKGDGCKVSPKTNRKETVCLCDHLTPFGADIVRVPTRDPSYSRSEVVLHDDDSMVCLDDQ
ncbi:uncharacterized protein LOC144865296 [Branchiostoma floridae x Branchiostoma japonicum]